MILSVYDIVARLKNDYLVGIIQKKLFYRFLQQNQTYLHNKIHYMEKNLLWSEIV